MADAADAVVVGSGPNGLVAANRLADAGWEVIVLEAAEEAGGAVRSGQLTLPGFTHDLFSAFYPLGLASGALRDLRLEEHGLRWRHAPFALAHPRPDGSCAFISGDVEETADGLDLLSAGDGAAWRRMIEEWGEIADPLLRALFAPFPPVRPAAVLMRRLGALGLGRFARTALLPARRFAEERFDSEGARLLLGGCALHTDLSPEAAGSGFYGWLLCCLGQQFGFPVPEGGAGALSGALVRRLEAGGGRVLCGQRVAEVVLRQGRAVGVRTEGGEYFPARRAVLADVPASTLYTQLVREDALPASFIEDVRHFQWDMGTVKVDWALERPVPWSAPEAARAGTVHLADDFDNLTEFSAQISMGRLPSRPFVVFGQQSLADPTRSPEGRETAWAYTHVPRQIRGDGFGRIRPDEAGSEEWLAPFVERLERRVEDFAPGFCDTILGRHIFSPHSMETANPSLVGGAIGGGTSQLHQQLVLRPVPGSGRSETPVTALYLASSSAHPGGGVHGAAGANAARAALLGAPRIRSWLLGRAAGYRGKDGVPAGPIERPGTAIEERGSQGR